MKQFLFTKVLVLAVCGLLASSYSCSSVQPALPTVIPNFNEIIFLTDIPCSAPCWNGLIIGLSTEDEVLAKISSMNFVDAIQVVPKSLPDQNPEKWVQGKEIIASCINRRDPCLRMGIANNKLRDIEIELDYGLVLDKVVNQFGNPSYIGYHSVGTDLIDCQIELIWPNEQLLLYSRIFSDPNEVNDECFIAGKEGTTTAGLIIKTAFYLPLEDIYIRIENDQLIPYQGLK